MGGGGGQKTLEIGMGGGFKEPWKSRWEGRVKKCCHLLGGVDFFSGITQSKLHFPLKLNTTN